VEYNAAYDVVVSADVRGMVEYWSGQPGGYATPRNIAFVNKTDTDLYHLAKVCNALCTTIIHYAQP
jgi:hypothetical protein